MVFTIYTIYKYMLPFYENIIRKMEAQVIFLNLFTVCIIFYGHICAFLTPSRPLHGHQFATTEKNFWNIPCREHVCPRMFALHWSIIILRSSNTLYTEQVQYIQIQYNTYSCIGGKGLVWKRKTGKSAKTNIKETWNSLDRSHQYTVNVGCYR